VAHLSRKDSHHVTTITPQQRTAVGRHRRELEVILASAPAGAAVVVSCTVPPATCGPPLHAHATSDETIYVLSGVLLVRDDSQVAAIPEGGLVRIGRGTPHTFATPPGAAARFLILHTRYDHGDAPTSPRRMP
jgi:quercetin dioxygenase-like cupin family protein